jgi:hypothetical protein
MALMGYRVLNDLERKYQPRKGLEGPFFYLSGHVLYYDPKAGQYYNPTTDFYVENSELDMYQNQLFEVIAKT